LIFFDFKSLNPTEIAEMVQVVLKIREQGVTILIIEHVMHALMNVSDRVIVLDYGQLIAEGTPAEIANHPKVIDQPDHQQDDGWAEEHHTGERIGELAPDSTEDKEHDEQNAEEHCDRGEGDANLW